MGSSLTAQTNLRQAAYKCPKLSLAFYACYLHPAVCKTLDIQSEAGAYCSQIQAPESICKRYSELYRNTHFYQSFVEMAEERIRDASHAKDECCRYMHLHVQ